ncbi:MAG: 23S rRNA (guanosine(2251)-2'-O)-methyltransferase RlmB [Actinobacteria bacterium]|nr:23S rRNA (guanosine(2251)-2'-O)-methyltransferase RlmB [Actinomycetota bacterium]
MHAIPGRRPVAEALRSGRQLAEVVVDRRRADRLSDLLEAAAAAGVATRRVPVGELDDLTGGVTHQGVAAVASPPPPIGVRDLTGDLVVVLDGITDPHNLGAIARSAEVAGACGLVLPRRRSAHHSPAAEKTSAGALSWLPVAVVPNIATGLTQLADAGFWSVGLDGAATATVWSSGLLDGRVAVVVGAEGGGLSRLVAERVDELVSIPMAGQLASLNASTAAAVALFEIVRRRSLATGA